MRKAVYFTALLASVSQAAEPDADAETETELATVIVEGTRLSDVSGTQVKSGDLAELLAKEVAGVSLVRRSGIANDIILRGQKKDNINILIDDAKVYGACPNRMDPTTSHILTNNVEAIEITEGPYDVQNFGTLSGAVKVITKKPSKEVSGDISVNIGSWGYQKFAATLSGGSDRVRAMASMSTEQSDQYEDGDGNNFAEQIENYDPQTMSRYKPEYEDLDAYEKKTFMGKIYVDITDDQELRFSYTGNRSDDVLYPSSKMDALYDDSDIFNLEYSIENLGKYSRALDFQYYDSSVEHPMSNYYRMSSGPGSANERISKLDTRMQGFKAKNSFDWDASTEIIAGIDFSKRNWDGTYHGSGMSAPISGRKSIDDVDTDNQAIFAEINKDFADFNLKVGARYDDTSIDPKGRQGQPSNDYSAFSGFATGTYMLNAGNRLFGGVGVASRVPDARELYFLNMMGMEVGTPTLDQTSNREIDLGIENDFENLTLKTRVFYSWLDDYIYFNADRMMNAFENIDATLYGLDITGTYVITDSRDLYLDFGLAYQRGRKDKPLDGQTDKDLAEIPPLQGRLALNYDYQENSTARIEAVAADRWSRYDGDNGEQELDSWAILNLKVQHQLTNTVDLTAGVDNLFNETYAVSNTYKDLILLTGGGGDVMLMNEPGRYFYFNAAYRF